MRNKKRNIFKKLGFVLLTLFGAGAVVSGTIFALKYTAGSSLNKRNKMVKEYNQFITPSALSKNKLEDKRSKSDFDNWVSAHLAETELLSKEEQILKYIELIKSIVENATNVLNKLINASAHETNLNT